jgi:hypothetical protein
LERKKSIDLVSDFVFQVALFPFQVLHFFAFE